MQIAKCIKKSFCVIGKEGSTNDGDGFIQRLWNDANSHFNEVQHLAKKDEHGNICGIWGAMSDFAHSFKTWENFKHGLYLAGVECDIDTLPPLGWTKWIIPSYEYICAECENDNTFTSVLEYIARNDLNLVGAVHDFICPKTGKHFMYFPIKQL